MWEENQELLLECFPQENMWFCEPVFEHTSLTHQCPPFSKENADVGFYLNLGLKEWHFMNAFGWMVLQLSSNDQISAFLQRLQLGGWGTHCLVLFSHQWLKSSVNAVIPPLVLIAAAPAAHGWPFNDVLWLQFSFEWLIYVWNCRIVLKTIPILGSLWLHCAHLRIGSGSWCC